MHPSEEPKHQSSQPGFVMWEYNIVGSLSLLVIESRKKFEVWNFLEVCLRSFRFEMSPRHTVLNHLVIYPVVIPVFWFHWPIFLCNWISKSSNEITKPGLLDFSNSNACFFSTDNSSLQLHVDPEERWEECTLLELLISSLSRCRSLFSFLLLSLVSFG